jgi:hypothetical protein
MKPKFRKLILFVACASLAGTMYKIHSLRERSRLAMEKRIQMQERSNRQMELLNRAWDQAKTDVGVLVPESKTSTETASSVKRAEK